MKISGIQNVPVHDRSHGVQQAEQQATPSAIALPEARPPTMDEQIEKSVKQVNSRIAAAIDTGSLTTRQAQALSEVQKDFEKQMGRVAHAMHDDGASRAELNDGMSKVYGNLLESLNAILTSGKPQSFQPFDALHASTPFDKGGLAFDIVA